MCPFFIYFLYEIFPFCTFLIARNDSAADEACREENLRLAFQEKNVKSSVSYVKIPGFYPIKMEIAGILLCKTVRKRKKPHCFSGRNVL